MCTLVSFWLINAMYWELDGSMDFAQNAIDRAYEIAGVSPD